MVNGPLLRAASCGVPAHHPSTGRYRAGFSKASARRTETVLAASMGACSFHTPHLHRCEQHEYLPPPLCSDCHTAHRVRPCSCACTQGPATCSQRSRRDAPRRAFCRGCQSWPQLVERHRVFLGRACDSFGHIMGLGARPSLPRHLRVASFRRALLVGRTHRVLTLLCHSARGDCGAASPQCPTELLPTCQSRLPNRVGPQSRGYRPMRRCLRFFASPPPGLCTECRSAQGLHSGGHSIGSQHRCRGDGLG